MSAESKSEGPKNSESAGSFPMETLALTLAETEKSMQSKGGEARAKSMTKEERAASARMAAEARWAKAIEASKGKLPRAQHVGDLKIGDRIINCAVLDNGDRVLSDRSVALTLGLRGSGAFYARKKKSGALLPEYFSPKYLQPFITDEIRDRLSESVQYRQKSGGLANGIKAALLPEICDIWLRARDSGALVGNAKALEVAEAAYILIRAFATVGIIALVDEATGFQELRDRRALEEILKKYIDGALYEWAKTFPIALYKEIFRLKGWVWNNGKMPSVVGHYTNDLVYDRLTKGMLEELKRLNPKDEISGRRKHRNYQFLTPDIGYPALNQRLYELLGMARASKDWDSFYRLVDRTFPRVGQTRALPFEEDV
jgi:hypothetical protein